ncbi:MAG TPA: DUF2567 domain-containing protein [Micromonosporaceae bacterium]|nr:DUF2567 domain-containing protein [Micromonosporaceae bacterium]
MSTAPDEAPQANGLLRASSGDRTRPGRRAGALVAVAVAVGTAILGIPYGLLWAAVAPRAQVVVVAGGYYPTDGLYPAAPQPEQFVAGDGWFLLLGFAFGLAAALAAWVVVRRWRGPLVLLALTAGAVGGGVLAWWVGHRMGLAEFERLRDTVPQQTRLRMPLDVHIAELGTWWTVVPKVYGVLLAQALAAAVGYTLLAGWSGHPALRPAPQPAGLDVTQPPGTGLDAAQPPGTGLDMAQPPGPGLLSPYPTGPQLLSSDLTARQAPTTAPAPPAPGAAEPPRD